MTPLHPPQTEASPRDSIATRQKESTKKMSHCCFSLVTFSPIRNRLEGISPFSCCLFIRFNFFFSNIRIIVVVVFLLRRSVNRKWRQRCLRHRENPKWLAISIPYGPLTCHRVWRLVGSSFLLTIWIRFIWAVTLSSSSLIGRRFPGARHCTKRAHLSNKCLCYYFINIIIKSRL